MFLSQHSRQHQRQDKNNHIQIVISLSSQHDIHLFDTFVQPFPQSLRPASAFECFSDQLKFQFADLHHEVTDSDKNTLPYQQPNKLFEFILSNQFSINKFLCNCNELSLLVSDYIFGFGDRLEVHGVVEIIGVVHG